jgi:hypothetical protein
MGCHSHKENGHEFQVCNTLDEHEKGSDCIGCHMPKAPGGNEKFNKRGRDEYATHKFLGIHSEEMVKKAVELKLSYEKKSVTLEIVNKMGHAIITHPMRLKFAKTTIRRKGKVIWSNFEKSPLEDKEATFIIVFKDAKDQPAMPHDAIGYKLNQNLNAMRSKTVTYTVPNLEKDDVITSTWVSYIVNPKVAQKLEITDEAVTKPIEGFKIERVVK